MLEFGGNERGEIMSDTTRQQAVIQSVSRAASILKCFYGATELGLSEISRMLGLHKSTAAGIINTLKVEGFLEQNEQTGKLRLGLELFSLAVQTRHDLVEICEPHLNTLLNLTGETVNLAVLDKDEIVYIAKKESSHSIRISTRVGTHLPIYCTAIGKAILAAMEKEKAKDLIYNIELKQLTNKTIASREELLAAIDKISREGVAYDFEEFEPGVICIASPLYYKRGAPIGAVSVSGPAMRLDEDVRKNIAKALIDISRRICGELSHLV